MNPTSATMQVQVGEKSACVKICGRANFVTSMDFRSLLKELNSRGYRFFLLDLRECTLMDSTFLGVLAGFGLKSGTAAPGQNDMVVELYHPTQRITELLDTLGVLHLFRMSDDCAEPPCAGSAVETPAASTPSHEEITRNCLEAHNTLMELNPANAARFKDVAKFLAEDLKKMKAE